MKNQGNMISQKNKKSFSHICELHATAFLIDPRFCFTGQVLEVQGKTINLINLRGREVLTSSQSLTRCKWGGHPAASPREPGSGRKHFWIPAFQTVS